MATKVEVRPDGTKRVQTVFEDESLTVQSQTAQADIRHILRKYQQGGGLSMRDVQLDFRDVTEFQDYADLARHVAAAKEAFMRLPARVRQVFHNDVENWLDAAHDQEKLAALTPKLRELGVIPPAPPVPVEPVHQEP